MRRKSRKISFRLNERQKEVLNEGPETRALPSSGSFLHMSGSSLEAALRSLAQQLVSARHMVPMLTEKGALSERRATDMVLAMRMCRQDVVEAHAQISSCLERLEGMHEAWVAVDVSGLPVASPLAQG